MTSCKPPACFNSFDGIKLLIHNKVAHKCQPAPNYYAGYYKSEHTYCNQSENKEIGQYYIQVVGPESPDEPFKIRLFLSYSLQEDHFGSIAYNRKGQECISQR